MKTALLFVLIYLGGTAVIFFAIAPGAARWYERYTAAAAERAEQDRVQSIALAEQRAKDDEIKRIREARFRAPVLKSPFA